MPYEDGSSGGGCLSALLTLLLLPYILVIYGYALLVIMVILIIEWLQENIQTIMLYGIPVLMMMVLIKTGLISELYQWIRAYRLNTERSDTKGSRDLPRTGLFNANTTGRPRAFAPSTNLYCYWCTRKLGLQSWERQGKYYCKDCYEKGRS